MAAIDKQQVARRFDRSAATYDAATPVQSRLRQRLVDETRQRLAGRPVRRILELGCGTGQLTRILSRLYPGADITAVDLAPGMIAQAVRRCPGARFLAVDAEEFVAGPAVLHDLVISNAAVQWFESLETSLRHCWRQVADGGLLAVSTFGADTFHELRQAFHLAYSLAGRTPRPHLLDLPPARFYTELFPNAAVLVERVVRVFPDVRAFLRSLQQAGVTRSASDRQPLGRSFLETVSRLYTGHFAHPAGGICVTYELLQLYCSKPACHLPAASNLDRLRRCERRD